MFTQIVETLQRASASATSAPVITPAVANAAVVITRMRPEHVDGVERLSAPPGSDSENFNRENLLQAIQRFPEGQFVALVHGQVVSYAITMRTHHSPADKPMAWLDVLGDMNLRNHEPNGDWLYGVDFAVDKTYRKMGIGTKMYTARFNLIKQLNLRGLIAGGMLMGYDRYRDQMSAREYGEKVMRGELQDPTVTMQIHRGFKPRAIVENYVYQPEAGSTAILIEWQNPQHKPALLNIPRMPADGMPKVLTATA